jgi:hypothetical protein
MKLIRQEPRNVYATWHRFAVLGRNLLADFEIDSGRIVRQGRGFRCECFVRGADASAGVERLLPVVSSAASESLIATSRSTVSARYLGVAQAPAGEELVAGVYWNGLNLHREIPVISSIGYGLESALGVLQQAWSGHRI